MSQANLIEQMVLVPRDGRDLPVFTAEQEKRVRRPAVIIIHEIFGLNEHIKDIARRFARQGMIAFAPDLFSGAPGLPEDRSDLNAMRTVWQKIPDAQLIEDLQTLYRHAIRHPDVMADKVGTVGFCMGGAIAYMFACSTQQIAWVADFYGRIYYPELTPNKPKHPIDYTSGLSCPMLGIFAGKDELITAEHVANLTARLQESRQRFEIKVYDDAQHAFFNDVREHYNADAAKDAWNKTLDFISRSIRLPGAR
jgi:carboxymethylenebutenolidase